MLPKFPPIRDSAADRFSCTILHTNIICYMTNDDNANGDAKHALVGRALVVEDFAVVAVVVSFM